MRPRVPLCRGLSRPEEFWFLLRLAAAAPRSEHHFQLLKKFMTVGSHAARPQEEAREAFCDEVGQPRAGDEEPV